VSTRYTNAGVSGGAIVGTAITDAEKKYSNTGTAVYGNNTSAVPITDLGFTADVTDLWIRLDYYHYTKYMPSLIIGMYFDGNTGSDYVGISQISLYYDNAGAKSSGYISDVYNKTINKIVVHVTTTSVIFYVNDSIVIKKDGINNGTKITSIVLRTQDTNSATVSQNDVFSNIIIADYDCSQETLAVDGNIVSTTFDLSRNLSNTESIKFDLKRTVTDKQTVSEKFDLSRIVSKSVSESFDLKRIVSSNNIHITEPFDLARNVSRTVSEKFDLKRTIPSNNAITFNLKRSVYIKKSFVFDLKRSVYKTISEKYDTKRIIPYSFDNMRIQSVTLSLQENTLTDHMSFDVAGELHPFDVMHGTFMDFPYRFTIDSTSQQELIQTCNSMYDFDDILTRYYKYKITSDSALSGIYASMHAEKIAAALGLTPVCKFDDFQPENNYNLTDVTYSNLVSSIFGWTTRLPRRQINIFMRGEKLYFLQRGNEPNTVDITSIPHSRPTIQREIVRSIDRINIPPQGMGLQAGTIAYVDPKFFDGQVGDVSYSEGLATSSNGNGHSIKYEYNGDKQVSSKIISNSDGSKVNIDYKYSNTSGGSFLSEQTETHISSSGNSSSKTTTYDTLGNGYVSATVHTGDGEYVGSSISMGGGNGEINGSTMNDVQSALGAQWNDGGDDDAAGSKTEIGWPVSDRATMEKILSEICWIYHSIKEQVNVEIQCRVVDSVPEYTHVIDFTDKIILGGNTYYLQSNTVKRDTKSLTQSLQLVRWYGGGTVSDKSDFVVNKEYSEV
jgi:hypothetical protein